MPTPEIRKARAIVAHNRLHSICAEAQTNPDDERKRELRRLHVHWAVRFTAAMNPRTPERRN